MMKDVLFLISLLLSPVFLFPQNSNPAQQSQSSTSIESQYESFRQTFDKETNSSPLPLAKSNQNTSASQHQTCTLPSWMLSFSVPDKENMLFTLGISDPGLDSANAIKQAVIRAKGLLALACQSAIQNITDSYTNEYNGKEVLQKFTSFSKFELRGNLLESDLQVYQQFFTNFGEAVVLAGIPKSGCGRSNQGVSTKAEYFLSEEGENDNLKMYSTYNLLVTDEAGNLAEFSAHKTKKGILVTTILNGDSLAFDYGKFKYISPVSSELSEDELLGYSNADLTNGLWNAWFLASLRQMENAEKYTSEIRRMDDIYSKKYQNLIREVSENKLGFEPEQILVKDNNIYLKLKQIKSF